MTAPLADRRPTVWPGGEVDGPRHKGSVWSDVEVATPHHKNLIQGRNRDDALFLPLSFNSTPSLSRTQLTRVRRSSPVLLPGTRPPAPWHGPRSAWPTRRPRPRANAERVRHQQRHCLGGGRGQYEHHDCEGHQSRPAHLALTVLHANKNRFHGESHSVLFHSSPAPLFSTSSFDGNHPPLEEIDLIPTAVARHGASLNPSTNGASASCDLCHASTHRHRIPKRGRISAGLKRQVRNIRYKSYSARTGSSRLQTRAKSAKLGGSVKSSMLHVDGSD